MRPTSSPRLLSVLLAATVSAAVAQAPAPATPAQPLTAHAVPTIRTSAQLVVVDVVVNDNSHKPVHGLKASDFTLTENGVRQTFKSFEEHTAAAAPVAAPEPPPPPGIFTNKPLVAPGGAVSILLLDSLNTPIRDQSYLHQQLLSYLKSAPPTQRIAIFGLSDHLVLLQGFNDDPAILRKLLTETKPEASSVRTDQVGSGIQTSAADVLDDTESQGTPDPMFAELAANLRQWDAQQQSLELQTRAKYTIDAFNQLGRALAALPGRKNLLWFSASFPLDVLPDTNDNQASDPGLPANDNFLSSFASQADVADEFRDAIDRLSRSQIAVYPIDVRGVQQTATYDADTTRSYAGNRGAKRFSADQHQFVSDTAAENGTMTTLAAATGGHAYIGSNDLIHAVKDSIEQGSNFYSLSYSPTDPNLDGKLRKIKVQLAHSGYSLSYRQGYYADPPDPIKTAGVFSPSAAVGSSDPTAALIRSHLLLAMARGAPQPTDILFRVGVVPITQPADSEPGVAANNTPTAKAHGPWRRYSVNYQIDPAGLVFFHQNGKVRTDFDLIVFVYTAQGDLLNSFHQPLTYTGSDHDVRELYQHGMVQHEEVSVPAKGEYFLRVAVHDLHRDHYGAIEIPTAQVANLKPVPESAETAPATASPAK
jgi:VWFA-related protein